MPNITIDVRMINNSGIGTYLKKLLPIIITNSPNTKFTLLGNKIEIEKMNLGNVQNVEYMYVSSPIYSISEQYEVFRKVPKDSDLLWVPHYNIPIFYQGKLLVTVHDVFHLAYYSTLTLPQKVYTKCIYHYLKRKSLDIITVSEFSKNEIIKYLSIDEKKIKVTLNGVDKSSDGTDALLSSKIKKDYENPYLIYIGNVKPHKNLKALITAFNSIKDKIPHDLIIIGKKEGFITGDNNVVKMADSLNGRVKFTGFIDDDKLRKYIIGVDAMVFPSYYEGFGLPPLEAMAYGTPVIASNAASIPEVCGDAALYFNPHNPDDIADKILIFYYDKQLQSNMREKGLKRSELFTWERCAEETIKIIEEVLVK